MVLSDLMVVSDQVVVSDGTYECGSFAVKNLYVSLNALLKIKLEIHPFEIWLCEISSGTRGQC